MTRDESGQERERERERGGGGGGVLYLSTKDSCHGADFLIVYKAADKQWMVGQLSQFHDRSMYAVTTCGAGKQK